ncbi:MAG: bifunctional hydroxymethylpyrimidine kinase/phosphomethylpyrimidine kinase [Myxococcota bacterium]
MPTRSLPNSGGLSLPLAALSIAGSDSGGGAGIQADLRTFAAHGLLGCTAITAITAQNTRGVAAWEPVSPALVAAQIDAVLGDLPVRAAKTGMLGTRAVIDAVVGAWTAHAARALPLVVDPVMVATSGHRLLADDAIDAVRAALLPLATVITPNLPEAAVLSGLGEDAAPEAHAAAIARLAPRAAIVVKGGHRRAASDEARDLVRYADGSVEVLVAPWVETTSTHGTGCTLSAAIAANLALGASLPDALRAARDYLTGALRHALPLGGGHGPVDHLWDLVRRR